VPLQADGLLLRSPEVGEYVVYDVVLVPIQEDEQEAASEMQGTIRVACVGIEQTDGATSRWIEIKIDLSGAGNPELHGVFKLLVPDEGVDDDKAFLPITRGWACMPAGTEPTEITPERVALFHPGFMFMRTVLASAEEPMETTSERTIHVNGEELTLTAAVSGEFAELSQPADAEIVMTQTGEGTWWTHEDYTFVPAADLILMMQLGEDGPTKGVGFQLDAVETGDDAVSELPDSN
jgi:hypothetical protein